MFEVKILQPHDAKSIIQFEQNRLQSSLLNEMDREFAAWHASWREESLNHYLPLGWCFALEDKKGELVGYFLAQPFLFIRGMTQTLWVERLVGNDSNIVSELIEVAYKISREKHLQKVLFFAQSDVQLNSSPFQLNMVNESLFELKTTKF